MVVVRELLNTRQNLCAFLLLLAKPQVRCHIGFADRADRDVNICMRLSHYHVWENVRIIFVV